MIQNQSIAADEFGTLAGTRVFDVAASGPDPLTINLVCDRFEGFDYNLHDPHLTATFTASGSS